jgi:GNAT superfamily N-acetyltransferase
MDIQILTVTGGQVTRYIPELAGLRIQIFREFPYLYEGSIEYEKKYLKIYASSDKTIIVLARYEGRIVGASTGIPLTDETTDVKRPFIENGIDPETVFYFGESILERQYRGRGVGVRFFEEREKHAAGLGYSLTAFCAVKRPEDHPMRPPHYISLDQFWNNRGYTIRPDLTSTFRWLDIGNLEQTEKEMVFWVKDVR